MMVWDEGKFCGDSFKVAVRVTSFAEKVKSIPSFSWIEQGAFIAGTNELQKTKHL